MNLHSPAGCAIYACEIVSCILAVGFDKTLSTVTIDYIYYNCLLCLYSQCRCCQNQQRQKSFHTAPLPKHIGI